MRTNWDSIPTQSQSDYAKRGESASSYHQPFAYDARDRHNGKAGRGKVIKDSTQSRMSVQKGRGKIGGNFTETKPQRECARMGDAFIGGNHAVYENPLDRVFRNGQWIEIAELNAVTRKAKKAERKNKKNK